MPTLSQNSVYLLKIYFPAFSLAELSPHGDGVIGFQGEEPAWTLGGIHGPAAPIAFILFPVPRLVLHFVFV